MARRQAARKGQQAGRRHRWLKTAAKSVAAVAVIGAAGAGIRWIADPATLPVESVRIGGTFDHVDRGDLRTAVEPFVAAGFVRLDMEGIRESLERIAWVRRASVRRAWPATLVVSVEEQRAAAVWSAGGALNAAGERFIPGADSIPGGLPILGGPAGSEEKVMARFREMGGILAALGTSITRLQMDERRAWRVELDNGLGLRLGRRDVNGRLLRFVRTYAKAIAPRLEAIESVDLRYTNGFAVHWKPGTVPAAA